MKMYLTDIQHDDPQDRKTKYILSKEMFEKIKEIFESDKEHAIGLVLFAYKERQ